MQPKENNEETRNIAHVNILHPPKNASIDRNQTEQMVTENYEYLSY